uniref:Uncharacterized protein n=1 Tax=Rhizophora mucronata TaxID=61149 RepID=A0A2P2NNE8_RHIMU
MSNYLSGRICSLSIQRSLAFGTSFLMWGNYFIIIFICGVQRLLAGVTLRF